MPTFYPSDSYAVEVRDYEDFDAENPRRGGRGGRGGRAWNGGRETGPDAWESQSRARAELAPRFSNALRDAHVYEGDRRFGFPQTGPVRGGPPVRLEPVWSRAHGGSPPGFAIMLEGCPSHWIPRRVQEITANDVRGTFEFMERDEQPGVPTEVAIHVREIGQSTDRWDLSTVFVITCPDELTAWVAFGAASRFFAVCPTSVDRRGWRPVHVRWVRAPWRGHRNPRSSRREFAPQPPSP